MSSKIRMMANMGSRFRHAGLAFGPGWQGYDVATMTDAQRASVAQYLGRFIRVHPGDEARLRELLDGKMAPANDNVEADTPRDASVEVDAPREVKAEVDTPRDVKAEADTPRDVNSEYAGMTVNDLRKLASELDVEMPTTVRRKADIIKLLEEATGS